MMMGATGNTEKREDINYVWTSKGKIALMIDTKEFPEKAKEFIEYDAMLHAHVADLEQMHTTLMEHLQNKLQTAADMDTDEIEMMDHLQNRVQSATETDPEEIAALKNLQEKFQIDTDEIEKEVKEFGVDNICAQGNWNNGIALEPFPKFFLVTKWVKKYFPMFYDIANKMIFYKQVGTKAPPFVQIKKHRRCFLFKGRDGPGTVVVNPEFAKNCLNELRDDLTNEDYDGMQFTVEIIGGKTTDFPNGLNGKLTCIDGKLFVIPMVPAMMKKFDPYGMDDDDNSYVAFKKSHPNTL